jgi:bacillithiol biosynthesis cysteine-adding enzyme BshC
MDPDCLAPEQLPQATRLYSTYLTKPEKLDAFYALPPNLKGIRAAVRKVRKGEARYRADLRTAVEQVLRAQNFAFGNGMLASQLMTNLSRLENGAVAVVTGQQVGLFGGPAYTFYKAITALRIANDLTLRSINAVPVFWMAGEDHDLAEVNHVYWPSPAGEIGGEVEMGSVVAKLQWTGDAGAEQKYEGRSVGTIPLGQGIEALVRKATDALGGVFEGISFPAKLNSALTAAYRPGETFGSAFGKLMAFLFAKSGLILLDSTDPRLHQLAAPLLLSAAKQQDELTTALLAQDKKLEKAGYHSQVKVAEHSTLFFKNMDGRRVAMKKLAAGFTAGEEHYPPKMMLDAIAATPELFSANALLRPVVQDYLLPTIVYVGGPAEIAYFAQNSVLYDRLLHRAPVILPRASFTLVEPEVARLLKRYKLEPADVFAGAQSLAEKMERRFIAPDLSARFDAEQKKLERMLADLRSLIEQLDPTLTGALDTAAKKMHFQLDKLRRKVGRAAGFRTGLLSKHERIILAALFPQHGLQERTLSLIPALARHGKGLFDTLGKNCSLAPCAHRFVRV